MAFVRYWVAGPERSEPPVGYRAGGSKTRPQPVTKLFKLSRDTQIVLRDFTKLPDAFLLVFTCNSPLAIRSSKPCQ